MHDQVSEWPSSHWDGKVLTSPGPTAKMSLSPAVQVQRLTGNVNALGEARGQRRSQRELTEATTWQLKEEQDEHEGAEECRIDYLCQRFFTSGHSSGEGRISGLACPATTPAAGGGLGWSAGRCGKPARAHHAHPRAAAQLQTGCQERSASPSPPSGCQPRLKFPKGVYQGGGLCRRPFLYNRDQYCTL